VCVLWERGEQEEYRRGGPVSLPVNKRRGDITQHLLCLQLHSYSVLDYSFGVLVHVCFIRQPSAIRMDAALRTRLTRLGCTQAHLDLFVHNELYTVSDVQGLQDIDLDEKMIPTRK
jgi:hypothetical protein